MRLKTAGAREVFIVEESKADSYWRRIACRRCFWEHDRRCGRWNFDIAVFSLGDIVVDNTIRIAEMKWNQDIVNYVREKYNVLIGKEALRCKNCHWFCNTIEKESKDGSAGERIFLQDCLRQ
jgi:actin-like ATPase involved in cell morphogenesis